MFFKIKIFGILFFLLLPQTGVALEDAFWLPADADIQLIPQAAPENITDQPGFPPEGEFNQYPDKVPPTVTPRKDLLTFYPCSQCHEHWPTDAEPRQLAPVHEVSLKHGDGRLWCLVCHDPKDRDSLHTVREGKVDFDDSWKVCGQCHANRQKDWYYGAHGKRVYSWQGEPVRYNCTHCHNPHRPPFMHQKPQPIPPVRAGLERMKHEKHHRPTIWERHSPKSAQENKHD